MGTEEEELLAPAALQPPRLLFGQPVSTGDYALRQPAEDGGFSRQRAHQRVVRRLEGHPLEPLALCLRRHHEVLGDDHDLPLPDLPVEAGPLPPVARDLEARPAADDVEDAVGVDVPVRRVVGPLPQESSFRAKMKEPQNRELLAVEAAHPPGFPAVHVGAGRVADVLPLPQVADGLLQPVSSPLPPLPLFFCFPSSFFFFPPLATSFLFLPALLASFFFFFPPLLASFRPRHLESLLDADYVAPSLVVSLELPRGLLADAECLGEYLDVESAEHVAGRGGLLGLLSLLASRQLEPLAPQMFPG